MRMFMKNHIYQNVIRKRGILKGCVCFTFATPDFTGACKMGLFFARSFAKRGYKVVAVCGPRPESDEPSVIDHLGDIGAKTFEVNGFEKYLNLNLIRKIAGFLRENNVDMVVSLVQMDIKIIGPASKIAGVPLIYSAQNITHFEGKTIIKKLKAELFGFILKYCSYLSICTSSVVRNEIITKFKVNPQKTELLPNGIDISILQSVTNNEIEKTRNEFRVKYSDILFINIGRLDEQKGQIYLLKAFAKSGFGKHVKLLLVGSSSQGSKTGKFLSHVYAQHLYRFVDKAGISDQVIFAGWRNDIPRLLCSSDIYVHSSIREGPSLPLAVLEAMAAKLPVIGTDCSGHPEGFQNDVHGNIVPKCKIGPLSEAMKNMVRMDCRTRKKMGALSRGLVESNFDVKILGTKFVDIIENKIKRHKLKAKVLP